MSVGEATTNTDRAMTYREQAERPPEIVIVSTGSTFRLRLRINLRQRREALLALALFSVVLSALIAWLISIADSSYFLSIFLATLAIALGSIGLPTLLVILVISARVHPNERLLPARLVLRSDHLLVFPRDGAPFEARWNYIHQAIETDTVFDLVLRRDPPLHFVLAKATLDAEQLELLRRWLAAEGRLAGKPPGLMSA